MAASTVKAKPQGKVTARFATLGVKDKDGDIIAPGAIGDQLVRVSSFGHESWKGAPPVGRGSVRESGSDAIADLQFFMNTTHGRDHFETLKGLGDLAEWSFGFKVLDEDRPTEQQRANGVRRILKRLHVHEVSPVLLGAGVDTATLSVKCDECGGPRRKGRSLLKASDGRHWWAGVDENGHLWVERAPTGGQKRGGATNADITREAIGVLRKMNEIGEMLLRHPPTRDHGRATRFALKIAAEVLRWQGEPPRVTWEALKGRNGFTRQMVQDEIVLALDLDLEQAVRTAVHEAKHCIGEEIWEYRRNPESCERQAYAFERKWGPVIYRAGREVGWDRSRVKLIEHQRPYHLTVGPGMDESRRWWDGRVAISRPGVMDDHWPPAPWKFTRRDGWRRLSC